MRFIYVYNTAKIIFLISLMLFINNSFSQVTSFVVNVINSNTKEEYYILKNNTSIKQGYYKKSDFNIKSEEGFYKNNERDSIWKIYESGLLSGTGSYRNNERIGIWNFYNSKNEITQKYNYTTKELLFIKEPKSCLTYPQYQLIKIGSDTTTKYIDRNAVRLGNGENSKLIVKYLNTYPTEARKNNIEGKVNIEYWINENGDVCCFKPLTNFGSGLEDEAMRIVKEILKNTSWVPAIYNNKSVSIRMVYPINFRL